MDATDPAEPAKSQPSPIGHASEKSVEQSRREAIQRLMLLGIVAPTASILIDMKVSSAFAEPGDLNAPDPMAVREGPQAWHDLNEPDTLLAWHGATVRLRAPSDSGLVPAIAHFLGLRATAAADPGAPDFIFHTGEDGYGFSMPEPPARRNYASRGDLMVNVLAQISSELRVRCAAVVLHAGAFVEDGEAVLISGHTNAGKSSLSTRAWLAGATLLGDDLVAIHDDHGVAAFPRPLLNPRVGDPVLVEAATLRAGAGNVVAGRTKYEERICVSRHAPGAAPYDRSWPARALYFIGRGASTSCRPLSMREALALTLPQVHPGPTSLRIAGLVAHLGAQGRLFALTVGDDDQEAALAILCELQPR